MEALGFPIGKEILDQVKAEIETGRKTNFIKIWIAEDVAQKQEGDFQRGYIFGVWCSVKIVKRKDIFGEPYQINFYPPAEQESLK